MERTSALEKSWKWCLRHHMRLQRAIEATEDCMQGSCLYAARQQRRAAGGRQKVWQYPSPTAWFDAAPPVQCCGQQPWPSAAPPTQHVACDCCCSTVVPLGRRLRPRRWQAWTPPQRRCRGAQAFGVAPDRVSMEGEGDAFPAGVVPGQPGRAACATGCSLLRRAKGTAR